MASLNTNLLSGLAGYFAEQNKQASSETPLGLY